MRAPHETTISPRPRFQRLEIHGPLVWPYFGSLLCWSPYPAESRVLGDSVSVLLAGSAEAFVSVASTSVDPIILALDPNLLALSHESSRTIFACHVFFCNSKVLAVMMFRGWKYSH